MDWALAESNSAQSTQPMDLSWDGQWARIGPDSPKSRLSPFTIITIVRFGKTWAQFNPALQIEVYYYTAALGQLRRPAYDLIWWNTILRSFLSTEFKWIKEIDVEEEFAMNARAESTDPMAMDLWLLNCE